MGVLKFKRPLKSKYSKCAHNCENSKPFSDCKCNGCDGSQHGTRTIGFKDVLFVIERKLHDPTLKGDNFKTWCDAATAIQKVLDNAAEKTRMGVHPLDRVKKRA